MCRLLREAKTAGLHTAVETCGFFEEAWLSEAVPVTDLFLWDFKDSDEGRHLANTGVSLQPILKNLRAADEQGASIRLRCILIRSVNLTREHLEAIAGLYASLRHAEGVDCCRITPTAPPRGGSSAAKTPPVPTGSPHRPI